ncbi:nonribosomal peptide synthetase fmqA [Aspergillus mulundensis]|uniref:Carrier domain-containing protein n=1 Tax=Aspergillus mulundensis TaxID=1810919 RepID=A0A3D8T341_9EURO|nr:hypothetical protein DSM5745_00295 [Aspergillus mulundensis]RDW92973.1 hypothetical protein DSM5745_00295 [Aspergillus mulundensis]
MQTESASSAGKRLECLFPFRTDSVSAKRCADRSCNILAVPFPRAASSKSSSADPADDVVSTLAAVWHSALCEYAEPEAVLFGVHDHLTSSCTRLRKCDMKLYSCPNIRADDQWSVSNVSPFQYSQFNTAIVVYQDASANGDARPSQEQLAQQLLGSQTDSDDEQDCDIVLVYLPATRKLLLVYRETLISHGQASHLALFLADSLSTMNTNLAPGHRRDNRLQLAQLEQWTASALTQPDFPTMHQVIHRIAQASPSQLAVEGPDDSFTYAELDAASSRVAAHLERYGVQPGKFIPVCFNKSAWAIVAMLAINKAGAAFVTLDASQPMARLKSIVGQLGLPPVALVSQRTRAVLDELAVPTLTISANTVSLMPDPQGFQPAWTPWHPWPHTPAVPAYCFFTSGSTGEPKGCVVDHAALSSVSTHCDALHLNSSSRALQFASFSFGVSLIEIWCTLSAGGCICMPSDSQRVDSLADAIESLKINWAFTTPTVLATLHPDSVPSLRRIIVAGEPLKRAQISQWTSRVSLHQGFGFTEWAGVCCVSPQIQSIEDANLIGAPANARAWLVQPNDPLKLAAIGAVAELVVQGPSLARGYLNKPNATAEKFLASTGWSEKLGFGIEDGPFYRTGDLVYYGSDGLLRYVSRRDLQVKIRGQRVNLGEPEYYITQADPRFQKAVLEAIIPADGDGDAVLVAFVPVRRTENGTFNGHANGTKALVNGHGQLFVRADDDFVAAAKKIKDKMKQELPDAMLPSVFVQIQDLPLTVSRKVDRRTLREEAGKLRNQELHELAGTAPTLGNGVFVVAPEGKKERLIRGLVADALGLRADHVAMDHDFFALGGDSVKAMRIVGLARAVGVRLTVKDLFAHPQLSDLAATIPDPPGDAPARNGRVSDEQPVPEPYSLLDPAIKATLISTAVAACQVQEGQIEDVYPCSPLQEGMMALSAARPGAYVARFVYRLNPHVQASAWARAWASVVRACPILRTRIVSAPDGKLYQAVIKDCDDDSISEHRDWNAYVEERQTAPLVLLGQRLTHATFLTGAVPQDAPTIENGAAPTYFIVMMHHAACDRWASSRVMELVERAYAWEALPSMPMTPFVRYLQQQVGSDAIRKYWKDTLDDLQAEVFPALPSPGYAPAPSDEFHLSIQYPKDTTASKHTMTTILRLAWALVISHYTCSNDVVFGLTVSGRAAPVEGIDKMTAPGVATVPFRVRLDPSQTVAGALSSVQAQSSEMIPFEQFGLQNIRRLSDSAADACNYQSHLVVQPSWDDEERPLATTLEAAPAIKGGFASCILSVVCSLTTSNHIKVSTEFDPAAISNLQVERTMRHFEQVVQFLLAHPSQAIRDVPLLSPMDTQTLIDWNFREHALVSHDECVHEIIERRCAAQPGRTAVCAWDGAFTYAELDGLSSCLAAKLRAEHSVFPETLVPICMEKSRWTTVAILGVVKAGGAFVLLDASQPQQRLKHICAQIRARFILTSASQLHLARELAFSAVVINEQYYRQVSPIPQPAIGPQTTPQSALYVVFTSGSTGTPKGVIVEHHSFCCSAIGLNKATSVNFECRLLQFASYSFDGSIMEILSTLMAGACLCVPSDFQRQNELASAAREYNLTHAHLTPSLARHLLCSNPTFTRTLVSVGEPLSSADLASWAANNPYCRVINGYGPSEAAVSTTLQLHVTPHSDPRNIGFPLQGISCWVVHPEDPDILLPLGAVGELLIEGPTVARGYLRNAKQSAAAFITSPPSWLKKFRPDGAFSKIYRTGDLVQYAPDGSLQYVGRQDAQVKLRGQRIELGEVENKISECWSEARDGGVAVEVASIARSSTSSPAQTLIAFVVDGPRTSRTSDESILAVPSPQFRAQVSAVLARLREILPAFMVPEIVLPLSSLPQSATGKLNRRRLRAIAQDCSPEQLALYRGEETIASKKAPATDAEHKMQAIWAQVLNIPVDDIGVEDNFYHLGGDSITAMQIVAHARTQGLSVSLDLIMRHKSIGQILAHTQHDPSMDWANRHIEDETEVWFALSPIQQMFLDQQPAGTDLNRFTQTFLLRLKEAVPLDQVQEAVRTLLSRHSMLRAVFARQPDDGRWMQMVRNEQQAAECRCQAQTVETLAGIQDALPGSIAAIDLENGPLLSVALINVREDRSQHLFLAIHHLAVDLVSWRTMLAELNALLRGGSLPQHTGLSFQRWCACQAQYAARSLPPKVALPAELPETYHRDPTPYWLETAEVNKMGSTQMQTFSLDEPITQGLLGQAANATFNTRPAELLHAALLHSFLQAFPARSAPLTFTEGHGREPWSPRIDIEQTVGWFTSAWPVVVPELRQHSHKTFADVVRYVQHAYRAIPGRGWAYFASRYLHPSGRRHFEHPHPMEVVFNYAGEFQQLERADSLFISDSHETQGALVSGPEIRRLGIFEIFASVVRGQLRFQFVYPSAVKDSHQAAITEWVHLCQQTLHSAVSQLAAAREASATVHSAQAWTVSDFPLLAHFTYEQLQELLETTLPAVGVPLKNVEDIYPCSPSQRGMLIAQAKNPGNYNASVTWEITIAASDKLPDPERVYNACALVIERHAALRTVFVASPRPEAYMEQVVLKPGCIPLDDVIVQTTAPEPRDDYQAGQLMYRFNLCRLEKDANGAHAGAIRLRLDISHAIMDRTTMRIIERDLCLAYENQLPLVEKPLYSAYIAHIYTQDGEAATAHWKERLHAIDPCEFPRLRLDRAGFVGVGGENEWGYLSRDLVDDKKDISSFCCKHNVTPWNLAALAWALVLRVYTHSDSVCFGYIKSGRDLPIDGIQDAVGAILNPLVCRVLLDEGSTVSETVRRLQEQYLEDIQHQCLPLSEAHQLAGVGNGVLFNTSVHADTALDEVPSAGVLKLTTVQKTDGAEDDLVVSLTAHRDTNPATLSLRYKTSMLSEQQATSVLAAFEKAVCSLIAADESASITALDLYSDDDRQNPWGNSQTLPPAVPSCVHELIQKHCIERPRAQAVCDTVASLTYAQLDSLSASLAHHLYSQYALKPNEAIPIAMDKTIWTPVAMLAVLRAGGAILLLDPSYPFTRKREVCEDVQARVVISSPNHTRISQRLAKHVVVVGYGHSSAWDQGQSASSLQSALPHVHSSSAVYVVSTSGSTGKPKTLVIEHESYATAAQAHIAATGLGRSTRTAQFASYAFDAAVLEQLSTLIAGGCICVLTDEQNKNSFGKTASELEANFVMLVPSVARLYKPADLPSIEKIMLIGEPVAETDIATWAGHVQLSNGYGPAECSALSLVQPSMSALDPRNVGFPVGCAVWLVDPTDHGRLVPQGAVGEVLIEGAIVGRGYANNPEAMERAFIEAPAWLRQLRSCEQPDKRIRLYKTGDLGRLHDDGSLIILGRKDRQVKVRGQRLELAEVEMQVQRSLQGYADDVVAEIIHPLGSTKPQLLAFIYVHDMAEQDEDATVTSRHDVLWPPTKGFAARVAAAEVKLRQTLPRYMIPTVCLPLVHMLRTYSGKVDRTRLRRLAGSMPLDALLQYRALESSVRSGKPPSSTGERTLARIWADVLDVPLDSVFGDDSFFLRGGHSIDAMKAAALARAAGMSLSVADMFAHPTLSDMASVSESSLPNASRVADGSETFAPFSLALALGVNPQDVHAQLAAAGKIPPSCALQDLLPTTQAQDFFIERGTCHSFNFTIKGSSLDRARLRGACQAVLARHGILRTCFVQANGRAFQAVLEKTLDVQICEQQCPEDDDPLEFCKTLWSRSGPALDVMAGAPPVRLTLVSHPSGSLTVLTIQISHAQWDGVSIPGLYADLAACYNQKQLPPTRDFADYAYHILSGPGPDKTKQTSLQFWREYLDQAVMAHPFPRALGDELEVEVEPTMPEPTPTPTPHGAGAVLRHGQTNWAFQSISPPPSLPSGITMATLVKAASAFFLSRHLNTHDVVFGHTVNGRNLALPHIESLLGCCLNFIPLRVTLPHSLSAWTIHDLLHHTQTQYTRALPHEHIELRDIRAHTAATTAWPADTEPLSFIVQHQNIDLGYTLPLEGETGQLEVQWSRFAQFEPKDEVWVFTEPHADRLEVQVAANRGVLGLERAARIAERLCALVRFFARDPGVRLGDVEVDVDVDGVEAR